MKFLPMKLHDDILKKLNELEKPQRYLTVEKHGFNRKSLMCLRRGINPRVENLISMCKWLESDIDIYFYNPDVDRSRRSKELFFSFLEGFRARGKVGHLEFRDVKKEFKKRHKKIIVKTK